MSRLPRRLPLCPSRRLRLALPLALAGLALAAMPALGPRPAAPGTGSAATQAEAGGLVAHTARFGLPLLAAPPDGARPPHGLPTAEATAPDDLGPAGPDDGTGIFLAGVAEGGSADLPAALSGTGGGGAPAGARIGNAPPAPGGHGGDAGGGAGGGGGRSGGGGGGGDGVGGKAPGGGTPSAGGDAPLLFTANQPIPLPPGGVPPARFDPPGRPPAGGAPSGEPPRGGETPEAPPRPPEIPPPAPTAAPEPGALVLLALPLAAIAVLRWSARRQRRDGLLSKPG